MPEYESRQSAVYKNYSVSTKNGKLYLSSKTPQEGYEEVALTAGGFTYVKSINAISGFVSKVEFKDSPFGKRFEVSLKDSDCFMRISTGLETDSFRNLTQALYGADFEKEVYISFYQTKKKNERGEDKTYGNCYAAYPNEKVMVEGKEKMVRLPFEMWDFPKGVKSPITGNWNWDKTIEFFMDRANELIARLDSSPKVAILQSAPKPMVHSNQNVSDFEKQAPSPIPKREVPTAFPNSSTFEKGLVGDELPF